MGLERRGLEWGGSYSAAYQDWTAIQAAMPPPLTNSLEGGAGIKEDFELCCRTPVPQNISKEKLFHEVLEDLQESGVNTMQKWMVSSEVENGL